MTLMLPSGGSVLDGLATLVRSESWTGRVRSLHVDGLQDPGKAAKKLVGGPDSGPPVIWTKSQKTQTTTFYREGKRPCNVRPAIQGITVIVKDERECERESEVH